ncbi:unnamed protein product [Gadus morhua 'NCC']
MNAFLDKDRTMPFIGNLYQLDHRPGQYYVDEGLMFGEDFHPDKVARKWLTLVQGYKKVKDHNASTGRGPGRFQFLKEMEELLGGHHDVDPSVLAGDGHVPNETPRPRKRPTKQDELVAYLQSSDEERADALKRKEDFMKDTLREMREDRRELLTQFTRMVDKM